ncbi:MAG: hypothetical protein V1837_01665 [Candidatus Woesearchaeota archaeon]
MKKNIPASAIRIRAKDLIAQRKTRAGWTRENHFDISNVKKIVNYFKLHNRFNVLLDSKDKAFLKGYLLPNNHVAGERIIILPNGKKLDRAYSLFSPHLTIHDQTNNHHWDVIYQNPNGEYAYVYTLDKKLKSQDTKYKKVDEFEKVLPKLRRNVLFGLRNKDFMALPLYTLLKTYMRVGGEVYDKINGHEGLTTLRKKDIKIQKDNVMFTFSGKNGVPQKIEEEFPEVYVTSLAKKIRTLRPNEYVFTNGLHHVIRDTEFESAFLKYCGKRFYPHLVRSYYATFTIEKYLKKNPHPTKNEIKEVYNEIAEKLGHKKFSKKTEEWLPSHTVTVAHYISPKLVRRINLIIGKK